MLRKLACWGILLAIVVVIIGGMGTAASMALTSPYLAGGICVGTLAVVGLLMFALYRLLS